MLASPELAWVVGRVLVGQAVSPVHRRTCAGATAGSRRTYGDGPSQV